MMRTLPYPSYNSTSKKSKLGPIIVAVPLVDTHVVTHTNAARVVAIEHDVRGHVELVTARVQVLFAVWIWLNFVDNEILQRLLNTLLRKLTFLDLTMCLLQGLESSIFCCICLNTD